MLVDLTNPLEMNRVKVYKSITVLEKGIRKNISFLLDKVDGDIRLRSYMINLGYTVDRTLFLWTDGYIPPKAKKNKRRKRNQ